MSLVYDKGKYNKYFNEIDQIKSKNNNQNIRGMHNKNINKNMQLYKDFMSTSPIRNINNNNKKTNFLTTYQNNNNSNINNNYYDQQSNNRYNKKNLKSHLKYNKSFEGNMINNDNFDFVDDGMHTIQQGSNFGHSKLNNNSVILNNKQLRTKNKNKNNKSVTRAINSQTNMNPNKNNKKSNFDENLIIKKLDEKFKSLENNIIDKKYENDIDHDEMIISTNKKNPMNLNATRVRTTNNINSTSYKLSNIIDDNNDDNDYFMNIFDSKNNIDFDENYLLNTSFENNRNDFDIMYTENYEKTVINDMLSLEIKLLIEKMLEIQKSYHKELNIIVTQNNKNEKIFKILVEKIKMLQKKLFRVKKLNETKSINGNVYNFIGIYNNNSKHEINNISLNEFYLWKYLMGIQDKKNNINNINNKDKLKELFKKIIFDKYYKISSNVNNIENQIILNLMKKFRYNMNANKKNGYMNNWNNTLNDDKSKIYATSSIQEYKNEIKQNRNINMNINNTTINNKKRHKKTSSCIQSKPGKLAYFRSGKQK